MRIVLSGGGTGGHATPLLALSAALKRSYAHQFSQTYIRNNPLELHYIGSGADIERDIAKQAGLSYHVIKSGKYRRYGRGLGEFADVRTLRKNLRDGTRFLLGVREARRLLKAIRPDSVFIKGGFVGLPVGLAASSLQIPLIIHESDSIMGMTNRILARRAYTVATGFPADVYPTKLQKKILYTGNLINPAFFALKRINHTAQKTDPTILILGGSTGARRINEAVWGCLSELTQRAYVIHQTGTHSINEANAIKAGLPVSQRRKYHPQAFIHSDLPAIMHQATLVISRAGANSVFEIAALAKPAIIIPLSNSANGHQIRNGLFLASHHAAHIINERDLSPNDLSEVIIHFLTHPRLRADFSTHVRALATPEAANVLANHIIKAHKHGK